MPSIVTWIATLLVLAMPASGAEPVASGPAQAAGQPSDDGGATWTAPRQAATVRNISASFFVLRLQSPPPPPR